jgi:hypothetical protein
MREIFNEILKHYKGDAAKASEMFRRACNWAADYSMQVRNKFSGWSSWFHRPSWLGGSKPMMNQPMPATMVSEPVGLTPGV